MSEYQWIEFRAVDGPLDDASLEFMRQQSTRAEISRWSFTNEYHFGDFRGDVDQMMRRGYDVHVHYANFGIRRIAFRMPDGFPFADAIKPYLFEEGIFWEPDGTGTAGILTLEPEGDAGTWEWMEDVQNLASDLIPIREMLIVGDLRPLYIAHLAFNWDDDAIEPPVPAGLRDQHYALDRLRSFYEIDPDLLSVASEASPEQNKSASDDSMIDKWMASLSEAELAENLRRCLTEPKLAASQLLTTIRTQASEAPNLGTGERTLGQLREAASKIEAERLRIQLAEAAKRSAEQKAAAEKALEKQLASIAENPELTIGRIDSAISERNRPAYQRAAKQLGLLAMACGKPMADAKADAIRQKYPTRSALSSELKKEGF